MTAMHYEKLESRSLMTVTAGFDAGTGELRITSDDAADTVFLGRTNIGTWDAPVYQGLVAAHVGGVAVPVFYLPVGAAPTRIVADMNGGDDSFYGTGRVGAAAIPMTINGGPGRDQLRGGAADDVFNGGDGDDTLYNSQGADVLNGGAGFDRANYSDAFHLWASADGVANDGHHFGPLTNPDRTEGDNVMPDVEAITGGSGINRLRASLIAPRTDLVGGPHPDELHGGPGEDTIVGAGSDDVIFGYGGNDKLYGGIDNDTLDGGLGNDLLFGQDGNDRLVGTSGADVLSGGPGNDTLDVTFDLAEFIRNKGRSIVPAGTYATAAAGVDTMNVTLDAGTFFTAGISPVLAQVKRVTSGLQSLANLYNRKMPVASVFNSNLTFGKVLDPTGAFSTLVNKVNNTAALFVSSAAGKVNLGSFQVSSAGVVRIGSANPYLGSVLAPAIAKLGSIGLDFPILRDPTAAAQTVLGHNVELVSYTMPSIAMSRSFNTGTKIFLFGAVPVIASASGTASLNARGRIGVDLTGVHSGKLLDGFYVAADTAATLSFSMNASAGVGVKGAGAGIRGQVASQSITLKVSDPNGDGKVRLSEFPSATGSPLKVTGQIAYNMSVYLKLPVLKEKTQTVASGTFYL